jgi:predicted N-acetyltransferase YhbS
MVSASDDYRFERLNKTNIADLLSIYRAAFGKTQALDYFVKKNDTQCFGVTNLGCIAYSKDGEPAAFYGAYTCIVEYKGQRYKAAQIGDAMTHPGHQRKGLFNALAHLTHEAAKQEGIQFLFTFPNKSAHSYPGFVKQQWLESGAWRSYVIRVRGLSQMIGKILPIGNKSSAESSKIILSSFSESRSAFKNSVIDADNGGIERSADFLMYKTYMQNFCLRMKNKIVWFTIKDKTLLIGDMEQCDPSTFHSIIRSLKRLARRSGLGYIEFRCSPGIHIEKLFDQVKSWKYDNTQTALLYMNLDPSFPGHDIKFTIADDDTF